MSGSDSLMQPYFASMYYWFELCSLCTLNAALLHCALPTYDFKVSGCNERTESCMKVDFSLLIALKVYLPNLTFSFQRQPTSMRVPGNPHAQALSCTNPPEHRVIRQFLNLHDCRCPHSLHAQHLPACSLHTVF